MDMMAIRRRVLMASGKKVIDTSPRILAYGYKYPNSNQALIQDDEKCATDKYRYEPSANNQTLVTCGVTSAIHVFNDVGYMDYWAWIPSDGYRRTVINARSTQLACTIMIAQLAESYAYFEETGQILFAGKNSPYYGYTNINDMP